VLDAYGNVPLPGILQGNHNSLGDFNSCIELRDDDADIQGQYCSIVAIPTKWIRSQDTPLIPPGEALLNVSNLYIVL